MNVINNRVLNYLYISPNIVRMIEWIKMRWAGNVAHVGEKGGVYRVLVGKPEGKRPLRKPSHMWEDNIKIDLQEVGFGDMDWIDIIQDRDR